MTGSFLSAWVPSHPMHVFMLASSTQTTKYTSYVLMLDNYYTEDSIDKKFILWVLEQLDLVDSTRELEIFFQNFKTRPSDSSYSSAF